MSNEKVMYEFREFGSKMQIIAILSLLSLFIPFVGLIQLIFVYLALGNIRNIYYEMPNPNLMEYRSKYIMAFFVNLIGLFFTFGAMIGLLFTLPYYRGLSVIIPLVGVIIFGIFIMIIAAYMESKAWEKLMFYLENNRTMFPEMIVNDAIKGAKNLKTGAILKITIILSIVGYILALIGLFQLSSLKSLYDAYGRPLPAQQQAIQPGVQAQVQPAIQQKTPVGALSFCPQCGAKIKGAENYCTACGSSLRG